MDAEALRKHADKYAKLARIKRGEESGEDDHPEMNAYDCEKVARINRMRAAIMEDDDQ